jgi:hypothetical protein
MSGTRIAVNLVVLALVALVNGRPAIWSMVWVSRTMEMAVRITSVTSEPMARPART